MLCCARFQNIIFEALDGAGRDRRVDAISMSERLALICLALVAPHATIAYSLAPAVPRNIAHRCPPLAACATLPPDSDETPLSPPANSLSPRRLSAAGKVSLFAACAASLFGAAPASLQRLGLGAAPATAQQAAPPAPKTLSAAKQKKLTLALKSKLAKVPVFMVTNEGGSPFLNRLASGDQSALMFLFPGEAEKMLEGVLKAPNGASSGAKVFPTNLDRAFKLARLEPMASGLRDQLTNRELTMVWQFMPHAAEQRAAQLLMAKNAKLGPPAVPCYVVENLVLTKRGKEVAPVFLAKKDADAAIAKLPEEERASAKIAVHDALGYLLRIAQDIEAGDPEVESELEYFELVPPSESVDFRETLKAGKAKKPPKIVPPDPNAQYR